MIDHASVGPGRVSAGSAPMPIHPAPADQRGGEEDEPEDGCAEHVVRRMIRMYQPMIIAIGIVMPTVNVPHGLCLARSRPPARGRRSGLP
jgi:hypothetical protein